MKEKLIAVLGENRLFYTHDEKNEVGRIARIGYIIKGDSDLKIEVDIDQVLSRGYWEEPEQTGGSTRGSG